jgi:hypothetical protein
MEAEIQRASDKLFGLPMAGSKLGIRLSNQSLRKIVTLKEEETCIAFLTLPNSA